MALKLSTGVRNDWAGYQAQVRAAKVGTNLAFVDGGAGQDTITSSDSDFITLGFTPNDTLFVKGATTAGNDTALTGVEIADVEAGTLYLPTGSVDTAEGGAAGTVVAIARGGSLRDLMKDGVLDIYSGAMPTSPDDAPSGTKLLRITVSAGSWAAGAFDNGIEWDDPASGVMDKPSGVTLQGVGLATGTAGYFRFKSNISDADGSSTTARRIDGTIGTSSGFDMVVPTTAVTSGVTYTVDKIQFTVPASA